MTWREHRSWSIAWFALTLVLTSMFYVYLIRQFGALPAVKENAVAIERLGSAVD